MIIEPIGFVKSPIKEGVDKGWGMVVSEIYVNSQFTPGLSGLITFSHIIVVFFMHQANFKTKTDLVRHPQGRSDMPRVGIFSQRAKHRPNPIGITTVELLQVKKNIVTVKGLDAIDDTPVLDIKPYFPAYDEVKGYKIPEWVERLMIDYF